MKYEVTIQNEKNNFLENEVESLNKKLQEALRNGLKQRKKNYYWKNVAHNNSTSDSYSQSYVDELNQQIRFLQNEKLELEEKIEEFVTQKVNFFHNGIYDDNIRMVYQDLLCMGLSTRNVEKVVKIVLKDLLGFEAEKLPKANICPI